MRIYWLNPPISTRVITADTAWMEISSACPNEEWIEPILDWDLYEDVEDIVEHILQNNPDMICISSYVWNAELCLDVLKNIKQINPSIITVRGGPHQPKNETFIDHFCDPLSAGEPFIVNLLNDLTGSSYQERTKQFPENSSLINHTLYLTSVVAEAKRKGISATVNIETTRGCPYSCTYCEWGGGIGTKITQKPIQNVYDEIDLCSLLGFDDIDIVDANFGILKRDVDIMKRLADNKLKYGYPKLTHLYGIAKSKVEKKERVLEIAFEAGLMTTFTMSLQGITEEVMKNIKRTDVPLQDILDLAVRMKSKFNVEPRLELILGLPGSTLKDFYDEMDLVEYTGNWNWMRYPFTILPSTEAANPFYKALHKIKTTSMMTPDNDMREIKGSHQNIISKYKSPQEIVVESYSFNKEEWKEMFFMNYAQRVLGETLSKDIPYSIQMQNIYKEISSTEWYLQIKKQLDDLVEGKKETDYLDYNGLLIEDWVTKYYINKEPYGSNN